MLEYTEKIQEISGRLLKEGKVDSVIGFAKGTVPMMNEPVMIRRPEDAGRLIWDAHCGMNLDNYLSGIKERVGIVAKGCDSRNIVTHIVENRINRDQVVIIGVPCKGMVDRHKITDMADGPVTGIEQKDGQVLVTWQGGGKTLEISDVLQSNCAVCTHRNPVISDEMVAEPVVEQTPEDPFSDVKAIEKMNSHEKWTWFEDLLSTCIRCYACRNACPLCYCPTCFVDEAKPQWVGKSTDPIDTRTFHFLRAYHCGGRCTDCGACERACPMGIPVRAFTRKLNKECLDLYGWEAGLVTEVRPPLDTFKPDDPEDFIR